MAFNETSRAGYFFSAVPVDGRRGHRGIGRQRRWRSSPRSFCLAVAVSELPTTTAEQIRISRIAGATCGGVGGRSPACKTTLAPCHAPRGSRYSVAVPIPNGKCPTTVAEMPA